MYIFFLHSYIFFHLFHLIAQEFLKYFKNRKE